MLEIRHLKTLHALREADSLVEAAERLHLTQSALSHQFKELEERLGLPIFVRKTKPIRFTSAGLRLLQLADATLPLLRSAERDIARLAGGTAGRLHMAIECHSCFQWLMPTIDQFRDAWPEVELDLASGFAFAPLPALARGDLDLVVTSDRWTWQASLTCRCSPTRRCWQWPTNTRWPASLTSCRKTCSTRR